MYNYENALIGKEKFLKKTIAETSNKTVVFFLINLSSDTMGLKFYCVITLYMHIYINIYVYIYTYVTYTYIYIYIYMYVCIYSVTKLLLYKFSLLGITTMALWQLMHLGTWCTMDELLQSHCVIIGKVHFHDYICITPILLLRDLNTLCVVNHLWPLMTWNMKRKVAMQKFCAKE